MVIKKGKNIKGITVQETNDNSILSKAAVATFGYFWDPFLPLFTTRVPRRSPLVHRGYYIRAKTIDHSLRTFIGHYCNDNNNQSNDNLTTIQIISLGAGFDTSYFRLKELGLLKRCRFVEIDFPDVVRRKINIIQRHDVLKDTIGQYNVDPGNHSLVSDDYVIIPCDLTDLNKLESFMTDDFKVDFDLPTLLFSECVLTYVDYQQSVDLLQWVRHKFRHPAVVVYEQVRPDDPFGRIMMRHFEKMQSPLRRVRKLCNTEKHEEFFTSKPLSYDEATAFDLSHFYTYYLDDEEKRRIVGLELFDEFEELHLKCAHYIISAAFAGTSFFCLISILSLFVNSCPSCLSHVERHIFGRFWTTRSILGNNADETFKNNSTRC